MARAEPVTIEKQGRAVAVVVAAEEYARLEAELERFAEVRLRESIADMEAGRVNPAENVFDELKNRHQ